MRECTIPMFASRANASKNCNERRRRHSLFGTCARRGERDLLPPVGQLSVFCSGLPVRYW